ncbi:MAG: sodium ion-translocating decarboxylase subunit beta [Lachnospiraceae bacterium]|nr:sodium ion-translocating decarboxylase subunit beta [Lachnospiraceae bacterium]
MKAESVSIIGGADGPTSIFLAGRTGKRSLKVRIRNRIFQLRRKWIARRIRPNAHTLEEVVRFMKQHYGAREVSKESRAYREQRECLKGALVGRHRPELLGELRTIPRPDIYNEESVKKMFDRMQKQKERAAQIPDDQFPMDYHMYQIRLKGGKMEIEIDFQWDVFGISYSGDKKAMKRLRRLSRRLHIYYGVSKEDIRNHSKRYSSLLTVLASD